MKPSPYSIGRTRRLRQTRQIDGGRSGRTLTLILAAALLLAMTSCVKLPKLDDALARARKVAETSKVYAADGTLITELHAEENRENVPLTDVPKVLQDAVISIEDERFYEHPGVDLRAIARAFFKNSNSGRVVEGGSTITQQYVKNVLVDRQRTLKRKLNEAVLAYQLEKRYTKAEILERYLNTVYFGSGAYGIQAAARAYFSENAKQLTLPQSAMIAGLIKSPTRYDPLSDAEAAKSRRNTVLRRMMELGRITPADGQAAVAQPLGLNPAPKNVRYAAPYFVEWVKQLIERNPRFSSLGGTVADRVNALFKGGLRIYTTVDLKAQRIAEASSAEVLNDPKDPNNALVSIEPDTGAVRAMVGGRDFFSTTDPYAKFNLAVQSRRQPGSSFKPFTLAAALESGIPLNKVYRGGSQVTIDIGGGQTWSPRNYESLSFGSSLTVREATIKSVNVVYAQMIKDVGPRAVVEMAHRLGITSDLQAVYAIALGTEEISPLELATAYCAFANGGFRVESNGIAKITDSTGTVLYEWKPTKTPVLQSRIVEKVVDTLQDVVRYGTGTRQRIPGRAIAGKTGTSEEYHDAWFAGFARQMVSVVWVGFPKAQIPMVPPYTRIRVVGGSWPGQIWKRTMLGELEGLPSLPFTTAATGATVSVEVDVSRNCLPNRFTPPNLISRVQFDKGTEPKKICTEPSSPVIVTVPRVTGRTQSDARSILERAGLHVQPDVRTCPADPGIVCAQSPAGGVRATAGDTVTITVAPGPVASASPSSTASPTPSPTTSAGVPAVIGLGRNDALKRLRDAGYAADSVFAKAGSDPHGGCSNTAVTSSDTVWAQSRCAGDRARQGSSITIYVNPI